MPRYTLEAITKPLHAMKYEVPGDRVAKHTDPTLARQADLPGPLAAKGLTLTGESLMSDAVWLGGQHGVSAGLVTEATTHMGTPIPPGTHTQKCI